jgi:hypothetical protein
MAAVFASHTGKSVMEDAAIQETVNHLFDVGAKKATPFGKTVVVDLFKSLKVVLNAFIVLGFLWLARAIYRRDIGHDRLCIGNKSRMPDETYCK